MNNTEMAAWLRETADDYAGCDTKTCMMAGARALELMDDVQDMAKALEEYRENRELMPMVNNVFVRHESTLRRLLSDKNANITMTTPINTPEKVEWALEIINRIERNAVEKGHKLEAADVKPEDIHMTGIYVLDEGKLIGGVLFEAFQGWIYLSKGFVFPGYRRLGLYKGLLHNLERLAVEKGFAGIYLHTYEFEAPLVYERLGYTQGTVLTDCPKGNTRMDYFKVLSLADDGVEISDRVVDATAAVEEQPAEPVEYVRVQEYVLDMGVFHKHCIYELPIKEYQNYESKRRVILPEDDHYGARLPIHIRSAEEMGKLVEQAWRAYRDTKEAQRVSA